MPSKGVAAMGKFDPPSQQRPKAGGLVLALAFVSILAVPTMGANPLRPADSIAPRLSADQEPVPQKDSRSELDSLLLHMSRVASLYTDEALRFTCVEGILYRHFRFNGLEVHRREFELDYIYVFNEPSSAAAEDRPAGLADYRTERSEPGEEDEAREVELDDLRLPHALLRAYSWVFLFREDHLASYDYEIKGHERVLGRDAVAVAFEALPPYRRGFNDWFGTAWIDMETYQLLRVEALSSSHVEEKARAQEAREARRVARPRYDYVTITTEFAVEKHGMRFPSKVSQVGTSVEWRTTSGSWGWGSYRDYRVFQVDQIYTDHAFFSVRTESEIRAFVLGGVQIKDSSGG